MRSLDNLNCRAGITPNFSDLPKVKQPAGTAAKFPKSELSTPHSASRNRSAHEGLVTPLCVMMILKTHGVGWSQGPVLKEVWTKSAPFQVFSPSNATCFYLWFPVQRPRYHFPAIKPKGCQMQCGNMHLGEIWLAWEPKDSWGAEPQKEARFRCTDLADLQGTINQASAPYCQMSERVVWFSSWQAKVMTNFALGLKQCSVTVWV